MDFIYCNICHGTISRGFGVVGILNTLNSMGCRNCKTTRCSKCSVGRYCKNCLRLLSPKIQKKALKSHRFLKIINNIVSTILLLDIFYFILIFFRFVDLGDKSFGDVVTNIFMILMGSVLFGVFFNIIMIIYQNILWESNLKK